MDNKRFDKDLKDQIRKAGIGSSESVKLINKALETSSFLNGGRLNRKQQAVYEEYIRGTGDMMENIDLRFTDRLRGQIDKMGFGSHVLYSHSENTNFTDTEEPAFKKDEYSLQKLTGAFDISYEAMVENIEKENFRSHLINSFLEKAAYDVSEVAVNGDTTSSDSLLDAMNGFYKLSDSGHIYDAGGAEISRSVFHKAFRTMPREFRRKRNLRWFMNSVLQDDYVEVLGNRATALGDVNATSSGVIAKAIGIPVVTVDEIRDDYSVDYSSATHAVVTGTERGWFTITTGTNDKLKIDIDNTGVETITIPSGTYSAVELAATINDEFSSLPTCVQTDGDGHIQFWSPTTGSSSEIDIQANADDCYTTLGLTVATTTGSAAGSNTIDYGTYMFLTQPDNFRVYVHEDFRTSWEYKPRYDKWEFTFHHYMQPVIVWPESLVRAEGIKLSDY